MKKLIRFARARGTFGRHEREAFQLELAGPIVIRYSLDGELVAAAPIDVDVEAISDPFRPTASIRQLLELQARHIRGHRDAARLTGAAAARALPDTG